MRKRRLLILVAVGLSLALALTAARWLWVRPSLPYTRVDFDRLRNQRFQRAKLLNREDVVQVLGEPEEEMLSLSGAPAGAETVFVARWRSGEVGVFVMFNQSRHVVAMGSLDVPPYEEPSWSGRMKALINSIWHRWFP